MGAVPSTVIDDGEGDTKGQRRYDTTTRVGQEAVALLKTWSAALDGNAGVDQPAPWRQTAGNNGSEFGRLQYLEALFAAYKKKGTSAEFALWELAHFDLMVRNATACQHRRATDYAA